MRKAIVKDSLREIRGTLNRFVAILAIVALGIGFYGGLKATTPDMEHTADVYYDDQHFMDLRLLSTMGFTESDVEELRAQPYMQAVMPSYTADVLIETTDGNQVIRMHSIPTDTSEDNENYLNRPILTSGRLPEKPGECAIDPSSNTAGIGGSEDAAGSLSDLGAILKLSDENLQDTLDILKSRELEVVGTVRSPSYISFQRGTTDIGSGRVSFYVVVPDTEFDSDYYIELYGTVKGAEELDTFSDEYDDLMDDVETKLEAFADERARARYDEIVGDAEAEIRDAEAELADGRADYESEKADAESKLEDARRELEDAQREIEDGEAQIASNEAQLSDGERQYQSGLTTFRNEMRAAENRLAESARQLESARRQYESGRAQLEEGQRQYEDGVAQLDEAQQQYDSGRAQLEAAQQQYADNAAQLDAAQGQLDALQGQIAQMEQAGMDEEQIAPLRQQAEAISAQIASGRQELEAGAAQIAASESELEAARQQIESNRAVLDATAQQLSENRAQLESAAAEISSGQSQLEAGRRQLETERRRGQAQLDASRREIDSGRAQLESARNEVAQGRADLEEGRATYNEEEADARRQLDDAEKELLDGQKEIDDARAELADLELPEWYILNRYTNMGFAGFASDSQKIANLSDIFPVFFFLVAALVCLTTMTRMVEEQRTQIGVLKALGYSKWTIASKYLVYAALATAIGCVVGLLAGFWAFPTVIWEAYRIMYSFTNVICVFHWDVAIGASSVVMACTVLAALAASYSELSSVPAELIRPKAPPPGKRVFLEKIPAIWSRLSFSQKVTARNLFRYKKRLAMTILGIAGCTALMLTGFGLQDAISGIVTKQFTEIHAYDVNLTLSDPYNESMDNELENELGDVLTEYTVVADNTGTAHTPGVKDKDVHIYVPQTPEELPDFIAFRNRKTGEPIQFPDGDRVVISEKLSDTLGAGVGDTILVTLDEGATAEAVVGGVTENYVYQYVYMTPEIYERMFGEETDFRHVLGKTAGVEELTEDDEALLATELIEKDLIDSVMFTSRTKRDFGEIMQTLNSVVILIIVCSTLLAVIVLYNLVNINITERIREIATIKVLGFFDNEVSSYVFRENLILTALGALIGLVGGVALDQFVVSKAEVDIVMFERAIHPMSFVYAFVLTMVFALLVDWIMHFRLKKISMVESLKSTE